MDIFTLTVIQSLANGIQVAALYGQYRTDRTHPGPDWWTLGSACIALGFVCNSLQHISGFGPIAAVANNALFFSGLALLYVGVLHFFGQRKRHGWLQFSGTAFLLLIAYFTFAGNDLVARHILVSSAVAILSFLIARALYVHKIRSVTTSAYFLAMVFATHGFFFVLRTIVLLTGYSVPDTLMQTATCLVTFVASTFWTFGFIIMVNQRLNTESRKNEEKYRVLFMDSPDAYLIIVDGLFVDCNGSTENMLRGNRSRVIGHPPELLSPEFQPDGRRSSESAGEKINEALKTGNKTFEWVHRRLDGEDFNVEVSIASMILNGKPALFTTWRDITERKKVEHALEASNRKLETLSITDGLTAIANRRHFDAVLAREHARHARSGAELALILLDIDHFKSFNDTYGHMKGDECLRRIGRVLAECAARPADLAARYGGEEFACILPETTPSGAIIIAEKIRRGIMALAIPHRGSSSAEYVTASLGVVSVQCSVDKTTDDILAQVDELLYRAKSSGRNRVEFAAKSDPELLSGKAIRGNFVQLAWKDSFCCGNRLIDSQHQGLFHIANKLFEAVLSGRQAGEMTEIIARLLAEAGQHFHDEEMILEAAGYPAIAQHIAEHATLLARGLELSEQFSTGTLTVGDVFQFLAHDVVMVHILGADREYFPFIDDAEGAGDITPESMIS